MKYKQINIYNIYIYIYLFIYIRIYVRTTTKWIDDTAAAGGRGIFAAHAVAQGASSIEILAKSKTLALSYVRISGFKLLLPLLVSSCCGVEVM